MSDNATEPDLERLRDTGDRFTRPYDEVFMPDGSLLPPMSIFDDGTWEPDPEVAPLDLEPEFAD